MLTDKNIQKIISRVKQEKINISHLEDDLIDHICCDAESVMENGISFNKAFEIVQEKIGFNGLKKIEKDTMLLIDKKYRIMKKIMNVFGTISLILLVLASVLKINHWPFAGPSLILGFFILCFIFFPAAIYSLHKESKLKGKGFIFTFAFLGGLGFMFGVLFKIMHWPGANIALLLGDMLLFGLFIPSLLISKIRSSKDKKETRIYVLGFISLLIYLLAGQFKIFHLPGAGWLFLLGTIFLISVSLPIYTYWKYKDTKSISGSFIYIIFTALYFVIFTSLTALNVSGNFLGGFYRIEKGIEVTTNYLESKNNIALNEISNQEIKNQLILVQSETKKLKDYINKLKIDIVKLAEGNDSEATLGDSINIKYLSSPDKQDPAKRILIGIKCNGKGYELEGMLINYKNTILSLSDNTSFNSLINAILDFQTHGEMDWVHTNFYDRTLISSINSLSLIEMDVLKAEREAITELLDKNENMLISDSEIAK